MITMYPLISFHYSLDVASQFWTKNQVANELQLNWFFSCKRKVKSEIMTYEFKTHQVHMQLTNKKK